MHRMGAATTRSRAPQLPPFEFTPHTYSAMVRFLGAMLRTRFTPNSLPRPHQRNSRTPHSAPPVPPLCPSPPHTCSAMASLGTMHLISSASHSAPSNTRCQGRRSTSALLSLGCHACGLVWGAMV